VSEILLRVADPIDFGSQFPGTLKRDNPALSKYQVLTGGRVSPSAFSFILDAEFAESRNQDIFTFFQGTLYDIKQGLNDVDGFFFGETELINCGNDITFSQSHSTSSKWTVIF
jgi:hypothetical protein